MNVQVIQNKIYEVRGQKVMFDFDLSELYEVETRALNQAVKRNSSRFPEDFMFSLNTDEWNILKSQIVTSSWGGTRKLPFAFTEHGVTMLSSVLKSEKAVKMNIAIIRAFIALKKFAIDYSDIKEQVEILKNRLGEHDIQLNQIYDSIENLLDAKVEEKNWENRAPIGFQKNTKTNK